MWTGNWFSLDCLIFLNGKPEWLVWIIIENIHKKIIRYKTGLVGQEKG